MSIEDDIRQSVKVVTAIYLIQSSLTASNRAPYGLASDIFKKEKELQGYSTLSDAQAKLIFDLQKTF